MPFDPKFLANSISVSLSPITYELARSYSSEKYSVTKPVLGFLVGALSFAKVLSITTLSNFTPSFSKVFIIKL